MRYDVGGIRHPGWREAEENPDAYTFNSERGEWVRRASRSGYTACACRDCMDITISADTSEPELCGECVDADCLTYNADDERQGVPSYSYECQRREES